MPRAKNSRRLFYERRAAGLCWRCGQPVVGGLSTCEFHREQARVRAEQDRMVWRVAAIQKLGGACVCCGEANPAFLELDHVDNDGARHRGGRLSHPTLSFYRQIVAGTCAYRIQLLCANCNRAKEVLGSCPHRPKAKLLWASLQSGAKITGPKYAGDLGFDLTVSQDTELLPDRVVDVPCSSRVALPIGYGALVIGRSSVAKRSIHVFSTLIDQGYRGDLFVLAQATNHVRVMIKAGERIGQLLLIPIPPPIAVVEVRLDELPESSRGERGFGSTGK